MSSQTFNIENKEFSSKPATSLFFSFSYEDKEDFVKDLCSRTWGNGRAIWEMQPGESLVSKAGEELISMSLSGLKKKFSATEFAKTSRSFRHRCGEYVDREISDISGTYLWFQLNNDLKNVFSSTSTVPHRFFKQKKKGMYEPLHLQVENVYLLVANNQQAILIIELLHDNSNIHTVVQQDVHRLSKSLRNIYVFLQKRVDQQYLKQEKENRFGTLNPYLGQIETNDIENAVYCPLLSFFGWLLFSDAKCPPLTARDEDHPNKECFEDCPRTNRLAKTHQLFRMHAVELHKDDWHYKDFITYYLRRGSKLEENEFEPFDMNHQFTKTFKRNWNHEWSVSRDGVVSISQHKDSEYNFVTERFWKGYQILTLQVVLEYVGCHFFNHALSKIAYVQHDKDKLTHLVQNINQFRLGINLVDFSKKASEAEFYGNLRQVFNIDKLLTELNDEVKDVTLILDMIERKEASKRRELKEEKLRLEDKERKERELELEKLKEKEDTERELARAQEDKRQQDHDNVLSLIGAATIPFAILSGLMGMNTNRNECSELTLDHFLNEGRVPCLTFTEVILICGVLSFIIYGGLHWYLRRNQDHGLAKNN